MAKFKFSNFVLPTGMAKFAYLDKPQDGFKPNDPPKFKVRVLLEDTPEIRKMIEELLKTGQKEANL